MTIRRLVIERTATGQLVLKHCALPAQDRPQVQAMLQTLKPAIQQHLTGITPHGADQPVWRCACGNPAQYALVRATPAARVVQAWCTHCVERGIDAGPGN